MASRPVHPSVTPLASALTGASRALQSTLSTISTHPPPPNAPPKGVAAQYARCQSAADRATLAGATIQASLISLADAMLILRAAAQTIAGNKDFDANVPVPIDLLDLMDHGEVNPEVYGRELLRRTLALRRGVRRRRVVMAQVKEVLERGIEERERAMEGELKINIKRKRDEPAINP